MAKAPTLRRSPKLNKTTIRDFGGGLNVIDTEQNLTSRFSPVFDNVIRYADGSVSPRYGYATWLKLKSGTEASGPIPAGVTLTFTNASPELVFNWNAHPFVDGQHLTLLGFPAAHGIDASVFNDTFSVLVTGANTFKIFLAVKATSSGTDAIGGRSHRRDGHAVGGKIIRILYFNDFLIVVTSAGEILRVAQNRTVQILWNYPIANSLSGAPPWTHTSLVAYDYWSGQVILSNGHDKPLRIDFNNTNKVDYITDPGMSSSNAAIPAFDACKSAFRYFIVHDTNNTVDDNRTVARISSKNTSVVYSTSTDAGDAVDVDVSKMIASANSKVVAFAIIKSNLMVIMPTSTVLLQLGNYVNVAGSSSVHEPIPADTMSNFGTSAPNSVVEVGSDVFMLDYNGVPSARLSSLQNTIVPERVSQLIEPILAKHIGRLSSASLSRDAFSVYDPKNKGVQFVLPKYDPDALFNLQLNALFYTAENRGTSTFCINLNDHQLEIGAYVVISFAAPFGELTSAQINGQHVVVGIINENAFTVQYTGPAITSSVSAQGGGNDMTLRPVNDQSVIYLYHYVPSLKINSWSRLKARPFVSGCSTAQGVLFMADSDTLYRYGSLSNPVYADDAGTFDIIWNNNIALVAGQRVRDPATYDVFRVLQSFTTSPIGSFAQERQNNPDRWQVYEGEPIDFVWELPWADFGTRQELKMLQHIHFDASGTGRFKVDVFVDNIYNSDALGRLTPLRSIEFMSGDAPGFGVGDQSFGGGRRTREQFLWPLPIRFKLIKLRITSTTVKPIRISAVSFLYQRGGLVRT